MVFEIVWNIKIQCLFKCLYEDKAFVHIDMILVSITAVDIPVSFVILISPPSAVYMWRLLNSYFLNQDLYHNRKRVIFINKNSRWTFVVLSVIK